MQGLRIFSHVSMVVAPNRSDFELVEDKGTALVVRYVGETRTHRVLASRFAR